MTDTVVEAERVGIDKLVVAYADARAKREEASEIEKELRKIEEQHEKELFDELERLNLRSVRHKRGLFTLNDLAWPKITDPVLAREWAEGTQPDLITLNSTRLGPFVREALAEGHELPPGVDVSFSRKINWRKAST